MFKQTAKRNLFDLTNNLIDVNRTFITQVLNDY